MSSSAVPSSPAPAEAGAFGRIIGVLFSPKATFESIVRRPTWALPLILLCILQLAVTFAFSQHVGWHDFMVRKLEQNPRVQQMSEEDREKAIEKGTQIAPIIGYVSSLLVPFISAALVAAVLLAAFNLLAGSKVNFKTALGIVSHSWVPGIIMGLLGLLIIFLKDPSAVDIENLVASNGGALLSENSSAWLIKLLTSLDIFSFWFMILMAMGFSATNPKKISFGKAFAIVFAVWLIYVLVRTGSAAVSS